MTNPVNNKKQAIVSAKDLNLILRILKPNWWIPLIILPIFYALGTFYVYRLTTVYKASTEFLLKSDDAYYKNNVLSDASFFAASSYMDNSNETRIIQSYDLSSKVVDKLLDRLQVSYFIVGKVRTTEQFSGIPFNIAINSINPRFYEQMFDLKIVDFENYEISFKEEGTEQVKKGKFDEELVDLDLIINITRDKSFTKETIEGFKTIFYQFNIHNKDYLVNQIRSNLVVENPEYTQILKVVLKDVIPERAILILDTLNGVYAESKLKSKFELNERTIAYIDKQLNEITFSLKNIEDTMQNYKEKKSIINLEWQQGDFLDKISKYDGEKSQMQLQVSALNDLEKYIIEDKDPQFLPPSVFIIEKGGFMTQAVNDLYTKQIELNRMYNVAKETNPLVADLRASIKKTKQDLLIYISNARKAANMQIVNLEKEISDYISEAKLIPGKQRDVLNIQRKATVSEELYNFLLEKKASTKIARASIVPDMKIVEVPRYAGVDSPDKPKIEKQFFSIGLIISILIIFVRAFFFTKIKTVEQLKEMTELPLIGVLPFVKDSLAEDIIVEQRPNDQISEAFRNLRTNLQYANIETDAKTYLVTSFLPGEGKTFTSVNLAATLAKSGKKTVIIELDLHKPRVYKRFGLQAQTKGITTCITGQNSFEEIVSETYVQNLYCIYSGPVPPNPSDFVLSDKMKEIITQAKAEFDYVIIDTPPAGLLSDSIYLIQNVDASIFVLNTRSSTKKVVTFIEEVIRSNNLKNVLLILNGVSRNSKRYYYQGYGYSYGYGYGYGYGKGSGYKK
ncbi:polysaccharide biosynthesis tyrosine autokinase [Aurantibacillus circumpalustris]|uniref:polysaccharide biosynthesis tyrosine autokinase n=1 Tax=Aurantibacillus circumpalustris TaxID=3036359 RepID=UPI00295B541D|nr:polysaccharide biosynthesis tyrosine autokinase [Aurantibacillus circumpalustris]